MNTRLAGWHKLFLNNLKINDMPTWLIALDIVVTTLWTIAMSIAALALWNASREFAKARNVVISLKLPEGFTVQDSE
mgnify:CR=1 FL=1